MKLNDEYIVYTCVLLNIETLSQIYRNYFLKKLQIILYDQFRTDICPS